MRCGVSILVLACVGTVLSGCESPGSKPGATPAPADGATPTPPVLRRQQATYPGLAKGRFISIADFETPQQVDLFRVLGPEDQPGDRSQPSLSILRARNETGAGSLKFELASPDERLVLDGRQTDTLTLRHDWQPYGLLLMSIHAPHVGGALELGVESDTPPLAWQHIYPLQPGWNLIQIDVATIGDAVNLADVRRITWRRPEDAPAAEFYLDDIILTDNTEVLIPRDATPGALHAHTRGRRIIVGATKRFELAWADGVIVRWTGPSDVNLADVRGLGPWPVPLSEGWHTATTQPVVFDDPQQFADWGPAVVTRQNVVESSTARIVIESEWRFVSRAAHDQTDFATRPGHRWRYTVYPSGAVHVHVVSRAPDNGWSQPRVGYAIALDGQRGFACHSPPRPDHDHGPFVHARRTLADAADLVWATLPPLARQHELATIDDRRLALLAGDLPAAPRVETAHLLRIWPTDLDGPAEALPLVASFRQPATVHITTGRRDTSTPGDLNHDGYNEATGCYEFTADGGVLRFTLDPEDRLCFNPVCRVHELAERRCWAYARGRLIASGARDPHNNLVIALGDVIAAPTLVEIYAEPPAAENAAP